MSIKITIKSLKLYLIIQERIHLVTRKNISNDFIEIPDGRYNTILDMGI